MDPFRTVNVVLDVGANNEDLLNDPLYVASFAKILPHISMGTQGWPFSRVRGQEYDNFVDKYVFHSHAASASAAPLIFFTDLSSLFEITSLSLLHLKDFGVTNAHRILDKDRDAHAAFNDVLTSQTTPLSLKR